MSQRVANQASLDLFEDAGEEGQGIVHADLKPGNVFLCTDGDTKVLDFGVATALRGNGIPCEVAPSAAKFGKQIRHADRRGIPYVWFTSTGDDGAAVHEVKDIRSGDQVAADPATWEPPSQDLRPRVLTTTEEVTAEGETP